MYHKVIIAGNLGRDPEMRYTPDGTPVTSFSVATNRRWTNADGSQGEETVWFRVTAWRRQAEVAAKYLNKGGLLPAGYVVRDGAVWQQGHVPLAMPEEEDFFEFLGLPWIAPEDRNRKRLLLALREALGARTPRETAFVKEVTR